MPKSEKELKPLMQYIKNREEMIKQAFSCIQETQLQTMMPDILKDMPLEELKAECLVQLLGMSKKRVKCVLEGCELATSSSSETETEEEDKNGEDKKKLKQQMTRSNLTKLPMNYDDDVLQLQVDQYDLENLEGDRELKHKRRNEKEDESKKNSDSKKLPPKKEKEKLGEKGGEGEGKNLLELLELEMRARAIRALLKQEEEKEKETSGTSQGNETGVKTLDGRIDLTLDSEKEDEGDINEGVEEVNQSWAERWLHSKDAKRVVATSKMITSVRKKMKKMSDQKQTPNEQEKKKSSLPRTLLEGSVHEYNLLCKSSPRPSGVSNKSDSL